MVFSSLFFVLVFLVLCYGTYAFMPSMRSKNIVLLVSSLIFYSWGGVGFSIILCTMTLICYFGALFIEAFPKSKKTSMVITVALCIGILAFFKYTVFLLTNISNIFSLPITIPNIILPIGISFYTFQLISYVVDVYRGEVKAQKKYWLLLLYSSLFSQCIAGPIVRYKDVNAEIHSRRATLSGISRGITRFCVGLAKKAIIANYCGYIIDKMTPDASLGIEGFKSLSALSIIFMGILYMIQIYLDFSAYSDMAIGMGLMIGFHFCENFDYPYTATSVTQFWRKWHMSLSSFFRDYVYIPLGGNRCSTARHIFNIFIVWLLTGAWHGANWNYIIWGLFFFVFLTLEKYVFGFDKDPSSTLSKILRHAYLLVVIFFSFIIFRFENMAQLGRIILGIFTLNNNPFADASTYLYIKNNCFFFIAAIIACTPIVPFVHRKLYEASKNNGAVRALTHTLEIALPACLLMLSVFALAGDSFNPFMYRIF